MYPKYYDAYIYRGKLYVKSKQYDKALYDFNMAIELNSSKALGKLIHIFYILKLYE